MYVSSCPNCGHPSPVSLARPDVTTCPACGFTGALPAEIQARLRAAGEVLRGIDVRHRQLTSQQRSILGSGCGFMVILGVIASVFIVPALFWAAVCVSVAVKDGTAGSVVVSLGLGLCPLGFLLLGVTVSYLLLRRVRQRLRMACAAAPPAEGGQTARCRVCSADLELTDQAIIRCPFCEADNVVDAEVIKRSGRSQHQVLEGFEQVVVDSGRQLNKAAAGGLASIAISLIVAPILAVVVTFFAYGAMMCVETDAHEEIRYAIIETPSGRCLAQIDEDSDGSVSLTFGMYPPPNAPDLSTRSSLDGLEIVTIDWVMGRQFRSYYRQHHPTGSVEAISGDLTGGSNYAAIDGAIVAVEGLCLIEPD